MKDITLVYEELEKKVEQKIKIRHNYIFYVTLVAVLLSIAVSFLNFIYYDIDLYDAYLILVPLIAYSFYNVFYQNDIKYSYVEKLILLFSLTSYVFLLLIYQFTSSKIIILFLNSISCIVFVLIIRSLAEHLYLRLLGFSLHKVTNNINKQKLSISNNKDTDRIKLIKYLKEINRFLYKIEYWIQVSPMKYKIVRITTVNKNLISIFKFLIKLDINGFQIEKSTLSSLKNILKELEEYFFRISLKSNNQNNIISILKYKINKQEFLIDQKLTEYFKEEVKQYFFTNLEILIQENRVIEFNNGIALYSRLIEDKIILNLSQEIKYEIVFSIYSGVFLLRKYLDNISTISGKFLLQTIAGCYQEILKNSKSKAINTYLFELIGLLEVKDSNSSTMRIYYHFLSQIAKSFDTFDDKLDFIQQVIWSLSSHEEEIAPLVFDDVESLCEQENSLNEEDIVKAYIRIHNSFNKKVFNRSSDVIQDYIIQSKSSKNETEVLGSLSHLFGTQVDYARYFFKSIRNKLSSGAYSLNDFILNKDHRLFKFEKDLLNKTQLYDELFDVLPSMIALNNDIVEKSSNDINKKEKLNFFNKTLEVLTYAYQSAKTDEQRISSIEWIRVFAKENFYNEYFRHSVEKLHVIGIKSLQGENWDVQEAVSQNFGWTLFDGFGESNIRIETLNNAFKLLVDFFKMACEYSRESVRVFIGTAIVINYIRFKMLPKQGSKQFNITYQINNIGSNNTIYIKTLRKSLKLKEKILDEYFEREHESATIYLKQLKEIIG